jgi:hypothetical protein
MRCDSKVMSVVVVARRDTDRRGYGSWPGKRSSPSWTFNEGTAGPMPIFFANSVARFPNFVDIIITQIFLSLAGPIECVDTRWVDSWQRP